MSKSLKERLKDCDEHDPRSVKLYEFISQLDFNEANDAFGFVSGGDGDNGEHLMYLLDCYFDAKDNGQNGSHGDDEDMDD
jgi:hypothetical protein